MVPEAGLGVLKSTSDIDEGPTFFLRVGYKAITFRCQDHLPDLLEKDYPSPTRPQSFHD